MFHAALTARSRRADPEKIISNSLILQTHKLASVRDALRAGEPPPFGQMAEPLRRKALATAKALATTHEPAEADRHWETLRGLLVAASPG